MNNLTFIGGNEIELAIVEELEQELDIKFPEKYKKLIIHNNGASVLPFDFMVGDLVESINNFFPVDEKYYFIDDNLPERVIPFARDAGGNKICFDYRKKEVIEIVFWDHGSPKNDGLNIKFVACSFDDFMSMLFEFDE